MGYRVSFRGVGMAKALVRATRSIPDPESQPVSPGQAFQDIFTHYLTRQMYLRRPSTLNQLLSEAPIPALRGAELSEENEGVIVASATIWTEEHTRAGRPYHRLWMGMRAGPLSLLKVVDSYTGPSQHTRENPAGYYIGQSPADRTLTPFEITRDEARIAEIDSRTATDLFRSLASSIPTYRENASEINRMVRRRPLRVVKRFN